MRKTLLSLTAATAIVAAASVVPASAMTVGTASGIEAALAGTSMLDEVAYVCRHRYYSSRRVCWWRPGGHHRGWRHRHWRRRW
jgi:hypothetical protein